MLHRLDGSAHFHGLAVDARLSLFLRRVGKTQRMRHQPDAGGMVGDQIPVVQPDLTNVGRFCVFAFSVLSDSIFCR